jgi:prepilin-type processing-associated H-X9-DG protein
VDSLDTTMAPYSLGSVPGSWKQSHNSYMACEGTWNVWAHPWSTCPGPASACWKTWTSCALGVMSPDSATKIAGITDGTSNTFLWGEQCHSIFPTINQPQVHCWQWGDWSMSMFDTNFPVNSFKTLSSEIASQNWYWVRYQSASSLHPGGANFGFCDGSVKFIKETIATWKLNYSGGGDPLNVGYGQYSEYQMGGAAPAVYQALSTRAGGEVISADAY